jgi:ribosomal protein L4
MEVLQNLKLRPKKDKNKKPKTTEAQKKIEALKKGKKKTTRKPKRKSVLLVLPKELDDIKRSFRNIPKVKIINADSLNVVDILKHQVLLMPVESLKVISGTYSKGGESPKSKVQSQKSS